MIAGFAKVHRRITEWEWYTDIPVKTLFLHLVITANHKDAKWRGIEIKRGEKLTSVQSLCKETGLKTQQVRTAILKLKSTGEITTKTTSKYTIISLCEYEKYNETERLPNKVSNNQENKLATNEQQSNNNQITTNKNDKNDKNEKTLQQSGEREEIIFNFWNETFGTTTKVDQALQRVVKNKIDSYGLQEVKRVIADYHKYFFGDQYWINQKQTLFTFMNGGLFTQIFHGDEETMKKTKKTDSKVKPSESKKGQEYKEPEFDVNDFLVN